jgi:ectoine hydroxylase-related dioxygenase (phytanoyl-CoA dioxygenase family)
MTEQEQYRFDLQGYLVIPAALDAAQLAALNRILDERLEAEVPPGATTHRFGNLLTWGQPFVDLIDNPRVVPYLAAVLGPKFRLDHDYADVIRAGKGPIGTTLHGGATPYDPVHSYHYENGRMCCGLSVIAYNLKDVNPGDGGFAAVPGSHKANRPFPPEWRELDDLHPCVARVTGPAGTAVLFTEALTHGTLPWRGRDERRTIFYKYSPNTISWAARYYDADQFAGLTETQRAILEPPNARYPGRWGRRAE